MEKTKSHKSKHKDLMATAILTAYPRIFSDIPNSRLIFETIQNMIDEKDFNFNLIELKKPLLAPELEYRYKVIDSVIKKSNFEVIVEIASGFSTRGLNFSSKNGIYIEIDLPNVIDIKKTIFNKIAKIKNSCHIDFPLMIGGNALLPDTWEKIDTLISDMRPIFVNEGLLRYLKKPDKAYIGSEISKRIKNKGGKWITADITLDSLLFFQDKNVLNTKTDIDHFVVNRSDNYTFKSVDDAVIFFKNATKLDVKIHKPEHLPLHSSKILGLSPQEQNELTKHIFIFEIQ